MSSEVARIREEIELEYEAARLGLVGLATVARHTFLIARQVNLAGKFERLVRLVGEERAMEMMIEIGDGDPFKLRGNEQKEKDKKEGRHVGSEGSGKEGGS